MRLFYVFQLLLCIFFDHLVLHKAVIDEENELTTLWTCEIKLVPGIVIILVSYAILWLPVAWIAACFERDIEGVIYFRMYLCEIYSITQFVEI